MQRDRSVAIGAAKQSASMNFVILDTETTGLGSLAHIVEFSCINREWNVLLDSLVNPGFPIPAEASAIHGITDADVVGRPYFPDLWPHVWDAIRGAEYVLVYNAAYDCQLIRQSLGGHREALAQAAQLTYGWIMKLYAQFYGQYSQFHGSYTWQKLVYAVNQCGLEMEEAAHRARADARASLALLKYMAAMPNGGLKLMTTPMTLQRRVKDWRGVTAKKLVYAVSDELTAAQPCREEPTLVGAGIRGWNFDNILW